MPHPNRDYTQLSAPLAPMALTALATHFLGVSPETAAIASYALCRCVSASCVPGRPTSSSRRPRRRNAPRARGGRHRLRRPRPRPRGASQS